MCHKRNDRQRNEGTLDKDNHKIKQVERNSGTKQQNPHFGHINQLRERQSSHNEPC